MTLRRGRGERGGAAVMGVRLRSASTTAIVDRALDAEHAHRPSSGGVREVVDVREKAAAQEGGPSVHPNGERGGATGAGLPRERGAEPRLGDEVAPVGRRWRYGSPGESEPPPDLSPVPPRPPRRGEAAHREELPQPRDHSEHVLSGPPRTSLPAMPGHRTSLDGRIRSGDRAQDSVIGGRPSSPRASRHPRRQGRARPEPATAPSRTSAGKRRGSGTRAFGRTPSTAGDSFEGLALGCP